MGFEIGLYYVCAIAGLVIVVGSLFLIWKGRIYIDAETNQVTKIELPLGIKLQTNLPVLATFIVGAFLLAFPIERIQELQKQQSQPGQSTRLVGRLDWPDPLDVEVVAAGRTNARGEINLMLPRCKHLFTVNYWSRNKTSLIDTEDLVLNGDETQISIPILNAELAGGGTPFGLNESRKENQNALSQFGK